MQMEPTATHEAPPKVLAAPATVAVPKDAPDTVSKGAGAPATGSASSSPPPVPYRALFRFADGTDAVLMGISLTTAALAGVAMPLFSILFGALLNGINSSSGTAAVNTAALNMIIIGAALFVAQYLSNSLAMRSSERQMRVLREAYFSAMLRQDQAFHDTHATGDVASRLAEDTMCVQDGIGAKAAQTITYASTFLAGIIIAFVKGWSMTLVMISFLPLLAIAGSRMKGIFSDLETGGQDAYAAASAAACEVFGSIRTVVAYGGEVAEVSRYDGHLLAAEKAGRKKGLGIGLAVGFMLFVMFSMYGVGLYFGATLVVASNTSNPSCIADPAGAGCFSGGTVLQVLFAAIIGAMSLGQVGPNMGAIGSACGAAARIYDVLDRVPPIDVDAAGGLAPPPDTVAGHLAFEGVSFAYPSRPHTLVLDDFSFSIPAGQHCALVGPSGCGKSTIVGLLLRLYDPLKGRITLDGVDLREYNVGWLRRWAGIVQQEPQLFSMSVRDNIALGSPEGLAASDDAVEAAAAAAHAAAFIHALPQGYATLLGASASAELSGGQKQRLALARVIAKHPRLLLLDEATSALDTASERAVQAALDELVNDRAGAHGGLLHTSVVIAHRLSTITHADRIVVLNGGKVVESGTHGELANAPNGVYASMWTLQRLSSAPGGSAMDLAALEAAEVAALTSAATAAAAAAAGAASSASSTPPAAVALLPYAAGSLPPAAATATTATTTVTTTTTTASTTTKKSAAPSPTHASLASFKKKSQSELEAEAELASKLALPEVPYARVWALQKPEAWALGLGLVAAAGNGVVFPAFAIVLSHFTSIFFTSCVCVTNCGTGSLPVPLSTATWDCSQLLPNALFYMAMFFVLAGCAFILNTLQNWAFAYSGAAFVRRLRRSAYARMLQYEIAFYDDAANSPGKLATRLGMDSTLIARATGASLGMTFQGVSSIVAGLVIAFVASWQIALLVLGAAPIIVIGGALEFKAMVGATSKMSSGYEASSHIASDSMTKIKTVAAFGLQGLLRTKFSSSLDEPTAIGLARARVGGLGIGFSQFGLFAVYSLCFWAGAQFIARGWTNFTDLMMAFFAIAMSATGAGHLSSFATDSAKAEGAKRSIFAAIDRSSPLDSSSTEGAAPADSALAGALEFSDVHFRYPSRPDAPVLRGLSFTVPAGSTVAIVGPSGSGKSTLIALLERFYDPASGSVTLDGAPLSDYNLAWLRSVEGWVQQEAPLFADSVAYNISYGVRGPMKAAPYAGVPTDAGPDAAVPAGFTLDPAVQAAATAAAAWAFVSAFEHGAATHVGSGGGQLSGGQKQRVAIARAIIRSPKLLLLDEATSALDSESEKAVSLAIEALIAEARATGGARTTLVIAHRLSTVRGADKIVVIDGGLVVEQGTHDELLRKGGVYRALALAQDARACEHLAE